MIVYRAQEQTAVSADLLAAIESMCRAMEGAVRPLHTDVQELLIEFGEFEAGVVDEVAIRADDHCDVAAILRRAAVAAGQLFCVSWAGTDCTAATGHFGSCLLDVSRLRLPHEIRISVPEGYAFYGLYPETYIEAAQRFFAERQPPRVCIIGIRSIGASLSAVVAAAFEELGSEVSSWTVRPRGHPFDRELRVADGLRDRWKALSGSGWFVVVDEGPGLSGSSFTSVVRALREYGIPAERIVLFPSWQPEAGSLVNERAREEWPKYRKYCGSFERALPLGDVAATDLSAGCWRGLTHSSASAMPPSQPQHEARKYLTAEGKLYKFSGLGRYGRKKLSRARVLAGAGWSPRAESFTAGFIDFDWINGQSMSTEDATPEFLQHMGKYIAFRRGVFPARAPSVSFEALLEMMIHNSAEALGPRQVGMWTRLRSCRREFEDRLAVEVDGRMMPHEWLRTSAGWIKTDSLDHSGDHFFPGQADPAWDVAAASVEFQLPHHARAQLLHSYSEASNDRVSPALMRFYTISYLAFRLGYVTLARHATSGTPDRDRFDALRLVYLCLLEESLGPANHQQVTA